MAEIIWLIILIVAMLTVFAFLYSQGYMVSKSISAVSFVGSTKGNSASFSSCSGYLKRVIKFKENGIYTFVLDVELSKGDISIELLDSTKQKIMQLNCTNRIESITVDKKEKYYLIINFRSATGSYALIRE
ncbi:MAG: hypothetical protein IJD96_01665 [Lachnospiraceae bacterium]|nr:hypothetical protein [Lachnospiraceae bacterium]